MGSKAKPTLQPSGQPSGSVGRADLHQAAIARRHAARRSRIGRLGLVLVMAAVAFVLLVMWLRDNVERKGDLRKLQASVSRLAEQDVPWQWPEGFVSATSRAEALGSPSEQMIVLAYQAAPRRLVLLPDGHAVAVWTHSQVQARWMTRDQLARQLRRQGLSLPDRTEAGGAETPQATQPSD